MESAETLVRWWLTAKDARANFDTYWEDVGRYVFPNQRDFTSQQVQGTEKNLEIYDDTPAGNSLKYAAVLEALLTRRSTRWHKLTATEKKLRESQRVQTYFGEVSDVLFQARQARGSGCYSSLATCYRMEGVFGNDALFIDDRIDPITQRRDGIRYKALPLRDCWITRDWQEGTKMAFRRYTLPAGELPRRFDPARVPERWLGKAKDKPLDECTLLTAIVPNRNYDPRRALSKPWSVAELIPDEKSILEEREDAYDELPIVFTSGDRAPGEDYGRGWAMDVLPSIKTLNEMIKSILRAAHKQADPPLLVRDDGVLGVTRAVRLKPGGMTRGGLDEEGRRMVDPLYTGANVGIAMEMLEWFQKKLDRRALVDLFTLLVERPQMTAAEILERSAEKGMFVGPIVGTHQEQKLAPMTDRELGILARQMKLPEMPPELVEAGGTYEMEYETPAQQLQRAGEVASIESTIASLAQMSQFDPGALEVIDLTKSARKLAELRGYPADCMRSAPEVRIALAERAKDARAAELVDKLPQVAKAAKDAAAALPAA